MPCVIELCYSFGPSMKLKKKSGEVAKRSLDLRRSDIKTFVYPTKMKKIG